MLHNLMRPREFQRRNPDVFNTYSALRYHLDRRYSNGLIDSGAVIETKLGMRIDPQRFESWCVGKPTGQGLTAA